MRFPRQSGLLLHVTSLPGRFGIGELGREAFDFIDFLHDSGQRLWQVLPLCPTAKGNSPYSGLSAFAGNPLMISPTSLIADGLLTEADLADAGTFPADFVDFERVVALKRRLLLQSHERFLQQADATKHAAYQAFCRQSAWWLDDFALFAALVDHLNGMNWSRWPAELVRREPAALAHWTTTLAEPIEQAKYAQFLFAEQWQRLHDYAKSRGVEIVGDMPIFVAYESADVWAYPQYFLLDAAGRPQFIAGVPPDAFSETGQLWGNPLFNWPRLAEANYDWWVRRLRHAFAQFDILRLDHFRGFESYWEVPADAPNAMAGRWMKGPGVALFEAAAQEIGAMRIIAEDLGMITDEVHALRDALGFPGMLVLQFASNESDYHHPANYKPNYVAYTGTHDNDTLVGWLAEAERFPAPGSSDRDEATRYWNYIELILRSVADTAIVPIQDILGLGGEARMNVPGKADGNWTWRMRPAALTPEIRERLKVLTVAAGRAAIA